MAVAQAAVDLSSQVQGCVAPSQYVCVLRVHVLCIRFAREISRILGPVVIDYFAIELYIREITIALDALSECENDPMGVVTRTNEECILEPALRRVCRGENCISIFEDKRRALIFSGCAALCLSPARIASRDRIEQRGVFLFSFFFLFSSASNIDLSFCVPVT